MKGVVAGIILAALTEAAASTVLAIGRADMLGDVHATPDEFAWLDVGYTALKLIGFLSAPLLMTRIDAYRLLIAATLVMGAACLAVAMTTRLDLLVALRMIQGYSGGALLVAGQAMIYILYPRIHQPILQAVFATGSVVAPATFAPAFQGWLLDSQSWTWIFFSIGPLALIATGILLIADFPPPIASASRRSLDWLGLTFVSVALVCFSYVFSQGNRWDWFDAPRILWLTVAGFCSLSAFVIQQRLIRGGGLLDATVFKSDDFCFAFIVSFVAGIALFGSAYLIPAFAVSVLAFTPTDAGLLLLPSGACFLGSLLIAAYFMQFRHVPPIASVPFGILLIMAAMWMLSGSTGESGSDDMVSAVLLRGLGLGFLFLSITLTAFGKLNDQNLASGIGIFSTGRQIGGLIGVAGLQTLIEHETRGNLVVLGAHMAAGNPTVGERLGATAAMLAGRGMEATAAGRAATSLLGKAISAQSTIIAFDTAFSAVALLFVIAAPLLVSLKIGLHYYTGRTTKILFRLEGSGAVRRCPSWKQGPG